MDFSNLGEPTFPLSVATFEIFQGDPDLDGEIWLRWTEETFAFAAELHDESFITNQGDGKHIFENDSFSFEMDLRQDELFHGTSFSFGKSTTDVDVASDGPTLWIKLRDSKSVNEELEAEAMRLTYTNQRAKFAFVVRWEDLGFEKPPDPGSTHPLAIAYHDPDVGQDYEDNWAIIGGCGVVGCKGSYGYATYVD